MNNRPELAELKRAAEAWAKTLDWPAPVDISEPTAQLDTFPDTPLRAVLTLRFVVKAAGEEA